MRTYVDSSVVLRILLGQPEQLARWPDITEGFSSEIIKVETLRTIDRTGLRGVLDAGTFAERRSAALSLVAAMRLTPISSSVLERAGDPFPTQIGTLDAIHLASAVLLRQEFLDLEFATHDVELAAAARAMGFVVHGV